MYICICRSITTRQVEEAVCQGARCLKDINEQVGVPIQCGKCCFFMKEALRNTLIQLKPELEMKYSVQD